jgi:hypothetical protein
VPPRLDAVAVADRLSAAGRRVEVVVAQGPAQAVAAAAAALGARAVPVAGTTPDAAVVDVRRRLNIARGGAAPDPLDDWCAATAPGAPLAAPVACLDWLGRTSARLADRLAARQRGGHYPVHGDPAAVTTILSGDVRRGIAPAVALATTVHAIRTGWERLQED